MEKYSDSEVGEVTKSSGAGFDQLNLRVEPFSHSIRDSMLKEITDIRIVSVNCPSCFNHRLETAMGGPKIPALVKPFRSFRISEIPESAELLLHRKGSAHFQVLVFQFSVLPLLFNAPVFLACQPKIFGTRQRLVSVCFQRPMLFLANLV